MATINPYLNFDGNCEEAFAFYRSVFGGEYFDVSRYSEMPSEDMSPDEANKLMHISLPISDGQLLMGADRPAGMPPANFGDSVSLSIGPDDEEQSRRIFGALAEGGTVTMPYERQFWGADFGMCTDKFGINWMVNYQPEQ